MSSRGLSLVGFVSDRVKAIHHLRARCVPETGKNEAALETDWRTARDQRGAPAPRAGEPAMRPIDLKAPHMQALLGVNWRPRFQPFLDRGASFQMVEIDALIAAQIIVDLERAERQCAELSRPPTFEQLLKLSFPLDLASERIFASHEGNAIIVKSESPNLVVGAQGPMPNAPNIIGVDIGWVLPLVQVTKLNGRCILHNGYHRAVGARLAGATEIPCLFRDVDDAKSAGVLDDANMVDEALVMSEVPPTLGHFFQASAMEVRLRRAIRVIQVSWAQHLLFDE